MANKNLDTPINRRRVRGYCGTHNKLHDNSTQLAESCADELDMYDERVNWTIPEFIFEISAEYIPTE